MSADDNREVETFYGVHTNNWNINFGSFSNHNKLLVRDYISDGCSCTETSAASDTNEFIYPNHIKKKYFIEGVIQGHITLAASTATSTVTSYRVLVGKVHENTGTKTELFSTDWITVNDTLTWNATYTVGKEIVYPFWIDAWNYAALDENERIYVKVEVTCSNTAVLYHSNDSTWQDLKIEIPLRL